MVNSSVHLRRCHKIYATPLFLSKVSRGINAHLKVRHNSGSIGARIGPRELLQLTWEVIDLERGLLRIHESKKKSHFPMERKCLSERLCSLCLKHDKLKISKKVFITLCISEASLSGVSRWHGVRGHLTAQPVVWFAARLWHRDCCC